MRRIIKAFWEAMKRRGDASTREDRQRSVQAMDEKTGATVPAREQYSAEEVIFREGEPANYAYVVESGLVEISTSVGGERRVLTALGPGNMFGELAALDGTPRSATATAITDTTLTLIVNDQLRSRVESAEPVLRLLLSVILKRFRREQNLIRHDHVGHTPEPMSPLFEPQTSKGAVDKITLESDLREALKRNELELHYQPILNLSDSTIIGFEALLRWQHTKLGTIPPQKFIGIAEETALIVPIGQWVLEQACKDSLRFEKYAANDLRMCVNVSGRQFAKPAFLPEVTDIVNRTGINPAQLELEITEGVLMDHRSGRWIEQCKRLGIRVAIDDFGTGFSSLSYLASFDLDTLKIDRSFVAAMQNDPRSLKIVRAVSQLAHSLGLDVIAEGVEESAQHQLLAGMGVESAQGFLFSRAQPFDDAVELL